MWNIRRQQQHQGPKVPNEDALWNLFQQRAAMFGIFVVSIAVAPLALRAAGLLEPINYSLARK